MDTQQIGILVDCAVDIMARATALREQHAESAETEQNVANMLHAALACWERATLLTSNHPPTCIAFMKRADVLRGQIAHAEEKMAALLQIEIDAAMAEAEGQTKH